MKSPRRKTDVILERFVVGPMGVNCYLLADPATFEACIIDPGAEGRQVKSFIDKNGYKAKFIVNTHGHGDHIAANAFFSLPIYIHTLDKDFLADPDKNMSRMFLFSIKSPPASRLLEDGDVITVGNIKLEVIHTPGHTPGSISLRTGGIVFSGDTLFRGGVGRTDFEYGDESALFRSIHKRLLVLPDDTAVYPGHGDPSTIGEEKRSNEFLI